MIRPDELASERPLGPWNCRGTEVWETICAAAAGDVPALRGLLQRDPNLYRCEYWYTQPIHFAVREGHLEATRLLLDAGADPAAVEFWGDDLITVARDRGHEPVARLLEEVSIERNRARPADADHEIHGAASAGDFQRVRALLDADPSLVHRRDHAGGTPLHRAVASSQRPMVELLLDRGADIHGLHGQGSGSEKGYPAGEFQPIDLALWTGPFWGVRGDVEMARLLLERGAALDLTIAAALGDLDGVRSMLDQDPARIRETRPCSKRAPLLRRRVQPSGDRRAAAGAGCGSPLAGRSLCASGRVVTRGLTGRRPGDGGAAARAWSRSQQRHRFFRKRRLHRPDARDSSHDDGQGGNVRSL